MEKESKHRSLTNIRASMVDNHIFLFSHIYFDNNHPLLSSCPSSPSLVPHFSSSPPSISIPWLLKEIKALSEKIFHIASSSKCFVQVALFCHSLWLNKKYYICKYINKSIIHANNTFSFLSLFKFLVFLFFFENFIHEHHVFYGIHPYSSLILVP